jgi:peptidoglycan hydrolase CwlO-like protein
MKREMDALKQDRDGIIDKLIKMSEQKATLEKRVNEYFGIVKDLEDVLAANKSVIDSQQLEYEKVKHERDSALKDADELRRERKDSIML